MRTRAAGKSSRFHTLVVLAALAGTAHFLAVGTVTLATAQLEDLALAPLGEATASVARDRASEGCALLETQAFDEALGSLPCVVDPPAEPALPPALPSTLLAECDDAPRRLVGTVVGRDRAASFAAIVDASGHASLLSEGALSSGATVARIDPEAVVLETSSSRCVLTLFSDDPPMEVAPSPVAAPSAALPPTDPLAARVRRIDDTSSAVDRGLVEELIAHPGPLLTMVRVVPHEEGGRMVGMRLYGLRSGSLLSTLGLRNGDTIRTVNGLAMSDPNAAISALTQLRTARTIDVAMLRDGAAMTLHVQIE